MTSRELAIPPHFDKERVGKVWRIDFESRAHEAREWREKHMLLPASSDSKSICLLLVDVQNTFCIPDFELFVAGRSGTGAVDDNRRLCEFIYRNLARITQVNCTLDTHQAMQIFHAVFLIDANGDHPDPLTVVTEEAVRKGRWRINPEICEPLGISAEYGQRYLRHYARTLKQESKLDWTIWPYHAMLGSIGHALVSAVHEAIFFHGLARYSLPNFEIKGSNHLTEHYSLFGPEARTGPDGEQIAEKNRKFIQKLTEFDYVLIAGQAKSHCVAWTIEDLLNDRVTQEKGFADKIYLLEDCTSPVVVSGTVDFAEEADAAFAKFEKAGMHLVRSTDSVDKWPGLELES